ncbi:MAG: hypothetical protein HY561_11580, partial [Gemmatimonadetes bacterium]|nr:hypothetical protein [Gemmatimonadota bacterium]
MRRYEYAPLSPTTACSVRPATRRSWMRGRRALRVLVSLLLTSALLPARISAQFVSLAEWKTLGGHGGTYIGALALSPDGRLLASADLNGLIKVWSVETGQELKRLRGPNEQITALALGPDGKILVSAHSLKTKIWSVDAAQEAGSIAGPMALGMGVAISPDGKWVASAGTDGSAGAVIL